MRETTDMTYIVKTVKEIRNMVKTWKKDGLSVGFVPTMGYLHEGHKSLIDRAALENDRVVVSIFVNPIQFGPKEDLSTYPRDMKRDLALCKEAGATVIFAPDNKEMYVEDFSTIVDVSGLTEELCGKSRPTHFRGVCTVVSKLFNIVPADNAYFGQKDAQQLSVIRRMVRDLNIDIEIIGCPIIREEDGLAKSSRNQYLSEKEREAAIILHKALTNAKKQIEEGETNVQIIKETICESIKIEPLANIDYVEIVDWNNLTIVHQIQGPVLVAIAVYIGTTRLIDNFVVE